MNKNKILEIVNKYSFYSKQPTIECDDSFLSVINFANSEFFSLIKDKNYECFKINGIRLIGKYYRFVIEASPDIASEIFAIAYKYEKNLVSKESAITDALESDAGRMASAQAMVEPIRRSLEYQAVGRKLLLVDEQESLRKYKDSVFATKRKKKK